MRVLHCFDKYLNSTMNWAFNAIAHMPDTQPLIAAPIIVNNQFLDKRFLYFFSKWQWEHPADEWSFSIGQRIAARVTRSFYWQNVFDTVGNATQTLVHAHFAQVGCAVLHLAKKHDLPLLTSFYGTDYEKLPFVQPAYREKYRELFKLSELLICEGEHGASVLAQMGCPESKIRVVPLGIEIDKIPFVVREKSPGRLRLLQAATIVEKKGYMNTLEAFRLASHSCPDIHLTIAGEQVDKKLVRSMRQYIADHCMENQITWLDFVDNRQFYRFLEGFEVFIHPSCYAADRDCEGGAPIVLLDAQATGLPVIATTHCDIPAEVLHEHTGLLAPESDIVTLAAHIGRFYHMGNTEYQKFSRNARHHVEHKFDVNQTAPQLQNLYKEVVSLKS